MIPRPLHVGFAHSSTGLAKAARHQRPPNTTRPQPSTRPRTSRTFARNQYRIELQADPKGYLLTFTYVFDDRPAAAQWAAGWDTYLHRLNHTSAATTSLKKPRTRDFFSETTTTPTALGSTQK